MTYKKRLIYQGDNRWLLPSVDKQGNKIAEIPMLFYGNDTVINSIDEGVFQQAINVANLPLIRHYSNTEDSHIGADCAIGATIVCDAESGHIAPTLVGYDIGCGMRVILTNLTMGDVREKTIRRRLIEAIERRVPTGVGISGTHPLKQQQFEDVLVRGNKTLRELGYVDEYDYGCLEEQGLPGALEAISKKALQRGYKTLCSLGGGNHFIEIQVVEEVGDGELAKKWGLYVGQVVVMVHTGSRGLGHQIATDYLRELRQLNKARNLKPVVPYMEISSKIGKRYLAAQAGAINFAVANKILITAGIYKAFSVVFGKTKEQLGMKVLYDILHNIARFEPSDDGRVLVIRKGATRALPPLHPLNPPRFMKTGHPAIIPGSMGTYSYLLRGLPGGKDNYYTVPHGAGRVLSRREARRVLSADEFARVMEERDILVNSRNFKKLIDEAPAAYKDIDEIVVSIEGSKRAEVVAKLRPVANIKGND